MTVPYANARSGLAARNEITKILRRFGCSNVGFMDDFEEKSLLLAFQHQGRSVQLRASARGWATLYLKENPWTSRRYTSKHDYEQKAQEQGLIAINSILRDWVKGQITAIETGIISFEAVFMPHMLTHDGVPLIEKIMSEKMLPSPQER